MNVNSTALHRNCERRKRRPSESLSANCGVAARSRAGAGSLTSSLDKETVGAANFADFDDPPQPLTSSVATTRAVYCAQPCFLIAQSRCGVTAAQSEQTRLLPSLAAWRRAPLRGQAWA